MNFSKRFFGLLNLYNSITFLQEIAIMDHNIGLYDLYLYVKNEPHTRMKKMCDTRFLQHGLKFGTPEAVFHRFRQNRCS